jgi:hypothetical protein
MVIKNKTCPMCMIKGKLVVLKPKIVGVSMSGQTQEQVDGGHRLLARTSKEVLYACPKCAYCE